MKNNELRLNAILAFQLIRLLDFSFIKQHVEDPTAFANLLAAYLDPNQQTKRDGALALRATMEHLIREIAAGMPVDCLICANEADFDNARFYAESNGTPAVYLYRGEGRFTEGEGTAATVLKKSRVGIFQSVLAANDMILELHRLIMRDTSYTYKGTYAVLDPERTRDAGIFESKGLKLRTVSLVTLAEVLVMSEKTKAITLGEKLEMEEWLKEVTVPVP